MTTKEFKVHYHQVDQMGVMHHAQYLYVLEQSRINWLQNRGVSYAALEKSGILLPVVNISIDYKRPLRFEDTFFVHTILEHAERSFVDFSYVLEDEQQKILTKAVTRLVFVSAVSRRSIHCPEDLKSIFSNN